MEKPSFKCREKRSQIIPSRKEPTCESKTLNIKQLWHFSNGTVIAKKRYK